MVAARTPVTVLHIITRLDRGGSAENVLLTAIGLPRADWQVTLATGPARQPIPALERQPASVEPLAEALLTLLTDANVRGRMGAQGRQRAQHYTVEAMVTRIDALYRQLLRDKGMWQEAPRPH